MKLADTERGRALPGSVVALCGDMIADKEASKLNKLNKRIEQGEPVILR